MNIKSDKIWNKIYYSTNFLTYLTIYYFDNYLIHQMSFDFKLMLIYLKIEIDFIH